MSDGFNWLITATVSNSGEAPWLADAFIQLLLLGFKSVSFHRWLRCLKELSIQLIASNNRRNTQIPPLTRTVASTITKQVVQDKENGKLLTDYQGETLPFVSLLPDCTFAVVCENMALFCCVKYRRRFLLQRTPITRKQKSRVRELNCKKEFGCEREQAICSTAPRESLAGWVMESQQEENICPWFGAGGRGGCLSLQAALPRLSPGLHPRDDSSLYCVQTEIRPCRLFNFGCAYSGFAAGWDFPRHCESA